MHYVRAGTLSGEEEEIHNGYVYQSDTNGIQASWLGQDGESGIYTYWVSVISDLGKNLFFFLLVNILIKTGINFEIVIHIVQILTAF